MTTALSHLHCVTYLSFFALAQTKIEIRDAFPEGYIKQLSPPFLQRLTEHYIMFRLVIRETSTFTSQYWCELGIPT
jgi:hypothetical protein